MTHIERQAQFPVDIEAVKIIRLEPGDKVFIKISSGQRLNREIVAEVREQAEKFFPGHEVIVGLDMDIDVLRPASEVALRWYDDHKNASGQYDGALFGDLSERAGVVPAEEPQP